MDFRPIATRCRLSIILTLTLHRRYPGLHFPSSIALIAHSCSQSHTHYITPTQILLKLFSTILYSHYIAVVDKVHRSSTWVKVQIHIIKYYSSKSTAFSILLEWKYKSTQFFMYLSKKVLIDRFILQFYIDYFISFYISTYFYNHTAQNTCVFPKITTIESRYIFCWYGLHWWEWCSNVHCEAYTAMYLRENRFHHLIFTSKKKVF